jgi:hypothetical protein
MTLISSSKSDVTLEEEKKESKELGCGMACIPGFSSFTLMTQASNS